MNDYNDDDGVNSSPSETLSKFWANSVDISGEKPTLSLRQGSMSARSDLIGLNSYQQGNLQGNLQVKSNGPVKSDNHHARKSSNLQHLSHTAAKHKISVKPKRNHPNPRGRRVRKVDEDKCDHRGVENTFGQLATGFDRCGQANDPLKQNSFPVVESFPGSSKPIWDRNPRPKIDQQQEKLSRFFHKLIGVKKPEKQIRTLGMSPPGSTITMEHQQPAIALTSKQNVRGRTKKKPPPPPPPTSCKPEPASVNVRIMDRVSGELLFFAGKYIAGVPSLWSVVRAWQEKLLCLFTLVAVSLFALVIISSFLEASFVTNSDQPTCQPFYSNFQLQANNEDNVIMKRNNSLGCLLNMEQSHERFQTSIQSWSLANEGFLKSLGSLSDKKQDLGPMSLVSNDSLMSVSSLIGENSMLDEPDCMEQTSLMISNHYKVTVKKCYKAVGQKRFLQHFSTQGKLVIDNNN